MGLGRKRSGRVKGIEEIFVQLATAKAARQKKRRKKKKKKGKKKE